VIWVTLALAGDQVVLSGRVESSVPGPIRVELIRVEEGSPQLLVAEVLLQEPGPFSVTVPARQGMLYLRVGTDADLDGIGPSDAQALLGPLDIQDNPIADLTFRLEPLDADP